MITINKLSTSSPVDFAAEELKKYLRMMMPKSEGIEIKLDPGAKTGYILGTMSDLGLDTSEVKDAYYDDIMFMEARENAQIISGSNPRSVLLSVYKFLKLNGCRWLFPGVDGEYIPIKEVAPQNYRKAADNRYRGQCNEGATKQQHYLDAIDFLPKIGMNTYMLEFENPHCYYDLWYNHSGSTKFAPEPVAEETVLQWKRACEFEIQKRGLIYHDMGHGWTQLPFRVTDALINGKSGAKVPEEYIPYLALVGGTRDPSVRRGLAVNACLSNPAARKIILDFFRKYVKEQSNVDVMHIALADDGNNHCECDECRKKTPSDWYVILLNEMDEILTEMGSPMKLDFNNYLDSVWAPTTERIKNPDRFVLDFAPISRLYDISYQTDGDESALVPHTLNKNIFPNGLEAMFAYYHDWRKNYTGGALAYEYHFWRMQVYDPSYQHIAHIIYEDIHGLKKHGIEGIIEDSTPRNFMPSGLAQTVFGESLFDLSLSFEEIEEDYMSHAFGDDWKKVRDFLETLGAPEISRDIYYRAGSPTAKRKEFESPEVLAKLKEWIPACEKIAPIVEKNQNPPVRSRQVLWHNLKFFLELVKYDARIWEAKYSNRDKDAFDASREALEYFSDNELEYQTFFDLGLWYDSMEFIVNPKKIFTKKPEDNK